jgi:hypothetical protein
MANVIYMMGDSVSYTGEKFKGRLNGKKGWIHAPVNGSPGMWVVEFPDTRDPKDRSDSDDYIMGEKVLAKWKTSPAEKKQEGPEIAPRRRRKDPEEA